MNYMQRLEFALVVDKCRGFSQGISMFLSICFCKKKKKKVIKKINAEAIKFLGILKKYFPNNKKIYFCLKK